MNRILVGFAASVWILLVFLATFTWPLYAHVFAHGEEAITVTTHFPEIRSETSARLIGFVENQSLHDVIVWFEWGESLSLNRKTTPDVYRPSTRLREAVESVGGLLENKSYYYRLVAQDTDGRLVFGTTVRFKTDGTADNTLPESALNVAPPRQAVEPPIVVTQPVTNGTYTSATLNGSVFPRGDYYTNGYFEWGSTSSFGNVTPSRGLGAKISMDYSVNLTKLIPNAIYYYRAVAQNEWGSNWGLTHTFVASPNARSASVGMVIPTVPAAPSTQTPAPATTQTPQDDTSYVPGDTTPLFEPDTTTGSSIPNPADTTLPDPARSILNIINRFQDDSDKDGAPLDTEEEPGASQVATPAATVSLSFFPNTFLGWVGLGVLLAVLIGLVLHIQTLYQRIKEYEERRARNNNGHVNSFLDKA